MAPTPWPGRRINNNNINCCYCFPSSWILLGSLVIGLCLSGVDLQHLSSFDSCSTDCTVESHLPCTMKEDCQTKVPTTVSQSSTVLNITSRLYYKDLPYLNISWQVPEMGFDNVQGFVIKIVIAPRMVVDFCRTLTFQGNARLRSADIGRVWYHSGCIQLDWDKLYEVKVVNLPLSILPTGEWPHIRVQTKQSPKEIDSKCPALVTASSEWCTDIQITPDNTKKKMTVAFAQAPSEFGITGYKIRLSNKDFPRNTTEFILQVAEVKTGKQEIKVFDQCIAGEWAIYVEPHELRGQSCSHSTKCTNMAGSCTQCKWSKTTIDFQPDDPCATPNSKPSAHVWAIILGICAGCLLTSIFVAIIIYRSNSCLGGSRSELQQRPSRRGLIENGQFEEEDTSNISKKRVLMLYSDDNKHHREAVIHLASLLRENCDCDVIIDDSNPEQVKKNPLGWIMKYFDTSSKIILVHSEGAFKKYHAKKDGNPYVSLSSKKEDLFTPAVEMLGKERSQSGNQFRSSQNTVSVFLPYTSDEFVIHEASPAFNYPLMRDMDSLFFHIHNLPRDDPVATKIVSRVSVARYKSLPAGKLLHKAIEDHRVFQEQNPDWFERSHVRTAIEASSDSGRGTLQESVRSRIFGDTEPVIKTEPLEESPQVNSALHRGHIYAELPEVKIDIKPEVETQVTVEEPPPPRPPSPPAPVPTPASQEDEKTPVVLRPKHEGTSNRLSREGSLVARLRQSFEASADSGLNLARENVRNRNKGNKDFSAANSPGNSLADLTEADEVYSKPVPKSARSSRDLSATSDFGGEITPGTSGRTTPHEHLFDKLSVKTNNTAKTYNRSIKSSIKDYSAFVDDAFGEALYGQSMGEPGS